MSIEILLEKNHKVRDQIDRLKDAGLYKPNPTFYRKIENPESEEEMRFPYAPTDEFIEMYRNVVVSACNNRAKTVRREQTRDERIDRIYVNFD